MSKNKIVVYVVLIVFAVIALSVLASAFYTVEENEYAMVRRFSEIVNTVDSSGLHFKIPVIDEVLYFPKTKLFYEITQSDVLTSDVKAMTADCFIIWEISDPKLFYQRLKTVSAAQARLEAITYNALKTTISTYEQSEIIGSADGEDVDITVQPDTPQDEQANMIGSADEKSRERLNNVVTDMAEQNTADLGVTIVDVKIKSFELPHDNEQSVFRRMISERDRFAAFERAEGEKEANMIKNEVDREANITVSDAKAKAEQIRAEGESEYMRLLAEAYRGDDREEFYNFMRGLDALKASLTGKEKTVILDKDSILAQILISP